MKRVLTGAIAFAALAMISLLPAQAERYWTGLYLGGNLGGGANLDNAPAGCIDPAGATNGALCRKVPFSGLTGWGPLGGAQVGINWQFGNYLAGFETDFQGAYITSKTTVSGSFPNVNGTVPTTPAATFTAKQTINWLGTARARFGYTGWGSALVYGTAGLVYGEESLNSTFKTSLGFSNANAHPVNIGWVAGLGVEYLITDRLSVKGEGLYYDAGTTTITGNPVLGYTRFTKFDMRGPIVRIGFNWRFGTIPSPPPLAPTPVAAPAPRPAPAPAPPPAPRAFIVYFDFDRATLTREALNVIDSAAATFKQGGSPQVQLAGYTDLSGSAAYNLRLSQRRADAVKAALIKDGVPGNAIDARGFGKTNPRVPTPDGVREPQNRRVEITE